MIVLLLVLGGLLLRVATARPLEELSSARLRGEPMLLGLLLLQLAAPALQFTGSLATFAFWIWLATFPVMALICFVNWRQPGIAMLGSGLVLNFAVIATNGGMPIYADSAASVRPGFAALSIPVGDFVHVLATQTTRLPWLADVIPLPGPTWLRALASPGDLLLFVGIVVFVALAGPIQWRVH